MTGMLGIAPPGYNARPMNSQAVTGMGGPGQQTVPTMQPSQYAQYYRSSYAAPSSLSLPSSIPMQQPYYGPPPDALAQQQTNSMVKALKGGQ